MGQRPLSTSLAPSNLSERRHTRLNHPPILRPSFTTQRSSRQTGIPGAFQHNPSFGYPLPRAPGRVVPSPDDFHHPGSGGSQNWNDASFAASGRERQVPGWVAMRTTHPLPGPQSSYVRQHLALPELYEHSRTRPAPYDTALNATAEWRSEGRAVEEVEPPLHTRPLYATIELPPVEDPVNLNVRGTQLSGEGEADVVLSPSAPTLAGPRNPNPMMASHSGFWTGASQRAQDTSTFSADDSGGQQETVLATPMGQVSNRSSARARPDIELQASLTRLQIQDTRAPAASRRTPIPLLNVEQLRTVLQRTIMTGAPSEVSGGNWGARLQERAIPATMPAASRLVLMVRGSGEVIRVQPSRDIVTVGDVVDALMKTFTFGGYLAGCYWCGGLCECARMAVILEALEVWHEDVRM